MNIMGKILVILNLVVALAVGGFLAVDFVTRTNWKNYTKGLIAELDKAKTNAGTMTKTLEELDKQVKQFRAELDTEKANHSNDVLQQKALVKVANAKVEVEEEKAKNADLVAQQALGEVNRLKEEAKDLNKVIEARQKKIVDMEKITKELRDFARAKEKEAQDDRSRNDSLKGENLALRQQVAQLQAGPEKGKKLTSPPVQVKGIIEKVDAQAGLVQISLGSDHGLKENHILQVQRLSPRPEYLGSIRIVEVNFHKSIGRWMMPRPEGKKLQAGDQVVSSLGR